MYVAKTAVKKAKRDVKVREAGNSALARFFLGRFGRMLIVGAALCVILTAGAFTYF